MKKQLHPKFWDKERNLDKEVAKQLKKIALDFIDALKIKGVEPADIVLTGSMANFNYNENSDLDLHILISAKDIDCDVDIAKGYLHDESLLWNEHHEIYIKGHEVEIYLQDKDEPHYSTGIYSLLKKKWIKLPKPTEEPDLTEVEKKARTLRDRIDRLAKDLEKGKDSPEDIYSKLQSLRKKIREMRRASLAKGGEHSTQNLVFKAIRRSKHMDKLVQTARKAYDQSLSLDEAVIEFKSFLVDP